jgi:ornithine decarboxylase
LALAQEKLKSLSITVSSQLITQNISNSKPITAEPNFILTNDTLSINSIEDLLKNESKLESRNMTNFLLNIVSAEKDHNNPIFIADLSKLVTQHLKWLKNLPTIKPFYATKCNNNSEIVRTLAAFGCGFDCASMTEIKQILALGVAPSKIIFANPIKPTSHLQFAFNCGVDLMTFDNADELEKIKLYHSKAKLVLRIRVDDSKSVCQFGVKFGVPDGHTRDLIKKIAELEMQLVGVSFHVGSGCGDPDAYYNAIKKAREVFDEAEEFGFKLYLLDIGGGFPGDDSALIKFDHHAKVIRESLEFFFSDLKVDVIGEPGRFYATSVMTLAANVNGRRVINNNIHNNNKNNENSENEKNLEKNNCLDKSKSFMYYISDGVYGSFNCVLYDHWELSDLSQMKFFVWDDYLSEFVIKQKEDLKHKKKFSSTIWGPTCDSMDCLVKNFAMPELKTGDWMVFDNAGAYTIAAGCEFNGFPRPKVYYLDTRISKQLEKAFYDFYNKKN